MLLCSNELFVVLAGIAVGGGEEATGQYGEDWWPYSFSSAVNLNAKRARPPATIRATQLTHFGTDQSPMMTGQSSKIRTRWNSATKVKIIPATQRYVFRSMGDYPNFNSGPTSNFYDVYSQRTLSLNVRYRGQPGQHMLVPSITGFDPNRTLYIRPKCIRRHLLFSTIRQAGPV